MRPISAISSDDVFELQNRGSVPSHVTTTSSSGDCEELSEQCRNMRCLSRISTISKFAMKLNQIHHIKICATYDESADGATVYVMNVYLRFVQKGLPPSSLNVYLRFVQKGLPPSSLVLGESESQRKKRLRLERELERPVYQIEHRYSAFRELRRRIMKTVNERGGDRYHQHCTYCSRVKFIDSSTSFPPRVPNRGLVATCTGWRHLCTYFRRRQLESFVNQLLKAAKDMSYRTGSG
ncbi:Hypothetical protein PHPALM_37821, partial [Phytophthora palmivora]